MLWLIRQPGRTTAERAGSQQRMLATVRSENFDTLENRVLHSYIVLASDVARDWLREHPGASDSARFHQVDVYRRFCRRLARTLADLGVSRAVTGITPNYVLMDDADYRSVYDAWIRLMKRERVIDELWAWQAQSWTDFCTLAVTLALSALDEAKLIAQSPILWSGEAVTGRWFSQDNPLAVFWLGETGLIVEVQSRPKRVSTLQASVRAHVWLRLSELNGEELPRRVPIWTPHCFDRHDIFAETREASGALSAVQGISHSEIMREGLILMQAFGDAKMHEAVVRGCKVRGVALDAAGLPLAEGMRQISDFIQAFVTREAT